MTIYLAGSEIGPFHKLDSSNPESSSVTSAYNSSFARCALGVDTVVESIDLSLPDDFWLHLEVAYGRSSSTYYAPVIFQNGGTDVLKLETKDDAVRVSAWNGSAWTVIVGPITAAFGKQEIDLHVVGNSATGTATLYIGGTNRGSATADLSLVTGIDKVTASTGTAYILHSQFILTNEPTVGWRLMTLQIDGAGADTDFTGGYTYIDETRVDDTDYINSSVNADVSTFAQSPKSSMTGYTIRGLAVYCRAKCGGSGPQNLQLVLRSGGTNYFSDTKALDIGYDSYGYVWNTNPASAGSFLASEIDALQIGVKAIT